jgi:hypothetical protein
MEKLMFKDVELYQITLLVLAVLSCVTFFMVYSTSRKRKELTIEIERKEKALKSKPIDQLILDLQKSYQNIEHKLSTGMLVYNELNKKLAHINGQLKFIDVGLFPPTFNFDDNESLKKHIEDCLEVQFESIRNSRATTAYSNWEWFGSKSEGAKMVSSYRNLLLKAFNAEFDFIRKQMRHSSYDIALKKLYKLEEQLSKLGETARVAISSDYLKLKVNELSVWHRELQHKENLKQQKKEQQALIRAQGNQSGDQAEEIGDELYYRKSDLIKAQKLASQLHGANAAEIELKISHIKSEINQLERKFERATSQAQLTRVGYIYVISNIGSFGEGVVKIGMTRRLEPMDRVNELGDASVPFKFDVHTLTFVGDAPEIERKLHQKFNDRRVNADNYRKEFFRVSLQQVTEAMEELGIECDWYFDAEAKEYRESLLMRKALKHDASQAQTSSYQLPASI